MTLISPESSRVTRLGMTPASTTHLTEIRLNANIRSIYVLDLLVRTVSQVGESPASISKNLGRLRLNRISNLDPVTSPLYLDAVSAGQGREGTA